MSMRYLGPSMSFFSTAVSMLSLAALPLTQATCGTSDAPVVDVNEWYLLGVNYPWNHYGFDFGVNAWGHYGVSNPAEYAVVEADFAYLQSQGVHVVRWFVFGDGRAAPEFQSDGSVTGLDDVFYADFDAAIQLAERYDLYLMPSLMDFYWCDAPEEVSGVILGGHSDTITDATKRTSLLENAIIPLASRYAEEPRILAWEVMNEPEWCMDAHGAGWIGETVSAPVLQSFVADVVSALQANSAQAVTLGSAKVEWMSLYWSQLPLELFQFHDYSNPPFEPVYEDLGLAVPVMVGEFPTVDTTWTVPQYLDAIYNNGFQGALPWALNDQDFRGQAEGFAAWSSTHQAEVDITPPPALLRE